MSRANNWYVITGGPSTGKTTLLAELEKLGYETVPEAARALINEAATKGLSAKELRKDEKRFQEDVARYKQKLEQKHNSEVLTFFDRGMHDTLAYMRHYGFEIEDWIHDLFKKSNYKKVFLLDPLPKFLVDYARTESEGFVKHIQKLLHAAYDEFGMKPIHVKPVSPKARAKFILSQIEQSQTDEEA